VTPFISDFDVSKHVDNDDDCRQAKHSWKKWNQLKLFSFIVWR
jgi:hypothetical protein